MGSTSHPTWLLPPTLSPAPAACFGQEMSRVLFQVSWELSTVREEGNAKAHFGIGVIHWNECIRNAKRVLRLDGSVWSRG